MIQVIVNDNTVQIKENSSVMDLLKELKREEDKRIAVALNNKVVSRTAWQETVLHNNDKIILIQAAYGG
ncbi:MAG: Sulfur carrier protein ThiS [Bacteroidetes bacterium ADurb.Bin234]|jgi:thiamine biosynthesis protein ThiS|nr:MAG: Sulfur carrier protein ThiS [Bacteroidetes bacterium ADurb.Bin234]